MTEKNSFDNTFITALYKQKNSTPKLLPEYIDIQILEKSLNTNSFILNKINENINEKLPLYLNSYLELELFPIYTDLITYRKHVVPDYYYPKNENEYYEISKYRDFQHFSLTVFWNKELLINSHLFYNLYNFIELFLSNALTELNNNNFKHDLKVHDITYHVAKKYESLIHALSIKDLFTLYETPSEKKRLQLCENRSTYFNRHINEKHKFNEILESVIKDTKFFEKKIIFISASNIVQLSTRQIKNALKTEKDFVGAIQAYLKIDPLLLYENNDYISVIIIEPTHLKLKYDTVKIYKGFTLDKYNGFFSIAPENLKRGLKQIKKHWVFRYFSL